MGRRRDPGVKLKEMQVIELARAGMAYDEIADQVGYASADAVRVIYHRAIDRRSAEGVEELRKREADRLDAMLHTIWPLAIEDPEWVRVFADKKQIVPLRDEEGREIVFIIPSKAKLDAIEKVLKLMERRARYFGLDHADGIAARLTQLREQEGDLMVQFMQAVLDELELTAEQRAKLPDVTHRHLALVSSDG